MEIGCGCLWQEEIQCEYTILRGGVCVHVGECVCRRRTCIWSERQVVRSRVSAAWSLSREMLLTVSGSDSGFGFSSLFAFFVCFFK